MKLLQLALMSFLLESPIVGMAAVDVSEVVNDIQKRTSLPGAEADRHLLEQIGEAHRLFVAGKRSESIDLLRALTKQYPQNSAPWGMLGGYYMALSYGPDQVTVVDKTRLKEAAQYLLRSCELDPSYRLVRLGCGSVLNELGRDAEALEHFRYVYSDPNFRTHTRNIVIKLWHTRKASKNSAASTTWSVNTTLR